MTTKRVKPAVLSQTQLRYAEQRIRQVCHARRYNIAEQIGEEPVLLTLSTTDKRKLIVAGKAKMKSADALLDGITYFVDAFDYPKSKAQVASEEAHAAYKAKRDALYRSLDAEREALLDRLYLGSEEEVLAMIETFSKGV